jgi:hypothetical protein
MFLFLFTLLLGPRVAILFWWLFEPGRWSSAFSTWLWPFFGFLFLPWTTLMFVIVAPLGAVNGWDWFWLTLAFFADVSSYASNGYANRGHMPGYA